MRNVLVLTVAAALACGGRHSPPSLAGRCYSVVWGDSNWAPLLPDTILLDTNADSSLSAALPGLRSIREISPSKPDRLGRFQYVGWGEAQDGTLLMLAGSSSVTWTARLKPIGDSLIGSVTGKTLRAGTADSSTFRANAHRVTCPGAAGA
jgi:hypothetical protein